MDLPSTRRLVLTGGLVLGLYALSIPVWLRTVGLYSQLVTTVARTAVFPLFGIKGGVQSIPGHKTGVMYTFPDPRTGKWARCRQRLMNFGDVPLALAGAAGLYFLTLRRRVAAALIAVASLFLWHMGLMVVSARRLSALISDPHYTAATLNTLIPQIASDVDYNDTWPIVVLVLLAGAALLLTPRAAVKKQTVTPGSGASGA